MSRTPARRRIPGLVALSALALTAACGNRVPHSEVAALGNGYGGNGSGTTNTAAGPAADNGTTGAAAVGSTGTGPAGAAGSATTGGAHGTTSGAAAPSRATTGAAATSGSSATGGITGAAAGDACTKALKPVVLGQTLAASGLVGATISNIRTGLALWAKDVNARGGLECHPVQLYQLDDGSDPARVSSNWNELVHNRGAVAVVGAGAPIAIAALRSAAERDKVPVVGGDVTAVDWAQSPYLFPQGGAPMNANDGGLITAGKAAHGGKAGMLYCVEASICTAMKNNFPQSTRYAHLQQGPTIAVSLTQSDYTSECQKMKTAGVTVVFLGLDGSASSRVARSCASLGYRPTFATNAIAVSSQAAQDTNLRTAGLYLGSGIVPYTESSTVGSKAFRAAMQKYGDDSLDQPTILGWSSGKLLEAALAKVSAKARSGEITTALILEGLYALKNETLNGLGPGISYVRGGPARSPKCYYGISITLSGVAATSGSAKQCL